jgi:hypothetical protein
MRRQQAILAAQNQQLMMENQMLRQQAMGPSVLGTVAGALTGGLLGGPQYRRPLPPPPPMIVPPVMAPRMPPPMPFGRRRGPGPRFY